MYALEVQLPEKAGVLQRAHKQPVLFQLKGEDHLHSSVKSCGKHVECSDTKTNYRRDQRGQRKSKAINNIDISNFHVCGKSFCSKTPQEKELTWGFVNYHRSEAKRTMPLTSQVGIGTLMKKWPYPMQDTYSRITSSY